jgi:hypothetical protein
MVKKKLQLLKPRIGLFALVTGSSLLAVHRSFTEFSWIRGPVRSIVFGASSSSFRTDFGMLTRYSIISALALIPVFLGKYPSRIAAEIVGLSISQIKRLLGF